jgi:3',5'-cyclic-AMP phosphodiesterase
VFVFAQVSDIHIGQDREDGGAAAAERARRVMAYLNELPGPIDAVLVTGDLADHGLPGEYAEVVKILSSRHPVFTCPGNHDVREAYRQVLLGETGDGDAAINRVHHLPGATLVMCDSSIPGRDDGLLDHATLMWLDETLTAAPQDVPAFVCFHHPPLILHQPMIDAIRLSGEQRLAEVLGGHRHVVAVLCGHAHTPAVSTFAGLPLMVAPGVVSTFRLPWEGDIDMDFGLPPMIAFHVLDDEWRLTTHFRVVG